jgi:hypothetical protein
VEPTDRRLERLEQAIDRLTREQHDTRVHVERIEGIVTRMSTDVADTVREIGGLHHSPGPHLSIRSRIHTLESSAAAARLAEQALAKVERVEAGRWTRREKVVGLALAAVAAAGTLVSMIAALQNGGVPG